MNDGTIDNAVIAIANEQIVAVKEFAEFSGQLNEALESLPPGVLACLAVNMLNRTKVACGDDPHMQILLRSAMRSKNFIELGLRHPLYNSYQ